MKGHLGICFVLFACVRKGSPISPVSKIAWINYKYGDDHVIDVDIERRPEYVVFAQDDVMSAVPRQQAIVWPGGVIPYEFDNFYIRKLKYKRKIESAMRMWESKTCIRFKKRTKEPYFLRIYHGHGCKAEVGYFPGISTVSLGRRCNDLSIILHELGHVIGFWHEQNRPDRDRYVQIIWRNINRGYQHAFRKYSKHQINSHTTNYDFYSVMHYGKRSFTKNGGLTIRPRDPAVKRLGGTRLSEMDIQETNLMYKCEKRWTLLRTRFFHSLANSKDGRWSNWSPWKQCSRQCGGGTQKRLRSCSHVTGRGSRWCSGSAVQSRACNTHRCQDWPRWPSDFKFGMYQLAPKGSYCARIYERRQYFQWMNYRLCWSSNGRKLNMRWSDSGAIRNMHCTHITEEREKKSHGWKDNFLCVESNTPYKFTWSSSGPITGLKCLQFRAKEGFDGWNNNFLCAPPYPVKRLAASKI